MASITTTTAAPTTTTMAPQLTGPDIAVVAVYFVLVIGVGVAALCRSTRNTVSGYFLAGRSMWFLPIGLSLFVSNIGTEHFIGLAGSGAASGISVGAWEVNALILLQPLGWIFVPVYIACGISTMPEYLSKRFGGSRLRVYFAFLSLVLYIFTKCSGDLFTGAVFIQQSLGWDLYVSIIGLILVTALLTITGGLTAVIYTDTLQACLMIGGALYLMTRGFMEIGGFSGLLERYPQAVPTDPAAILVNHTCHHPDKNAFRLLRDINDPYLPWLGFLLGQTPGSIWYWCADQVIVQRVLAAKSISHAQGAVILSAFIKILPLFMMVMPGMISRVLYPNEVACTNPDYCYNVCQSRAGCTNIAFPRLVLGLMPVGARGLMMAVMIAALMSDLDSIFNSASTLFTIDVWKRFRRNASVRELMIVGRVFIIVMVGVSVAWVPVIKETQGGQVFIYIQEVTIYLAPPFAAVFTLGVLVPRVNEKGAFYSLMVAFVIGVTRLVLVFVYQSEGHCGAEDRSPSIIRDFHYMYFSPFLTATTALLAVLISLCTEKPDPKQLCRTTFWTRHEREVEADVQMEEVQTEKTEKTGSHNLAFDDLHNGPQTARDGQQRFTDPGSVSTGGGEGARPTLRQRFLKIVCGFSSEDAEDAEKEAAMREHLRHLAELRQSAGARLGLTVGLVAILAIGVFMMTFFSVYPFPAAPFYPLGRNASSLLPGDVIPQDL